MTTTPPPIVPGNEPTSSHEPLPTPPVPPAISYGYGSPMPPATPSSYGYDPNQHIQVISRPGGLSGAAHAVHILICFFTCGLWIPGYIAFIVMAPNQRFDVVAPFGADPQLVARARLEAEARAKVPSGAPAPGTTHALPNQPMSKRSVLMAVALIGGFFVLLILAMIFAG